MKQFSFILKNDVSKIKAFYEANPEHYKSTYKGSSPFMFALYSGFVDAAIYFFSTKKYSWKEKTPSGENAFVVSLKKKFDNLSNLMIEDLIKEIKEKKIGVETNDDLGCDLNEDEEKDTTEDDVNQIYDILLLLIKYKKIKFLKKIIKDVPDFWKFLIRNHENTRIEIVWSPLSTSILMNCKEIVDLIVNENNPSIDINGTDGLGGTPLIYSITSNTANSTEIFDLLLKHPQLDVNEVNSIQNTPLVYAMLSNNPYFFERLINHPDIDVNKPLFKNITSLHIAILLQKKDKVKTLLEKGADLSVIDSYQHNILLSITRFKYPLRVSAFIKILFENGAEILMDDETTRKIIKFVCYNKLNLAKEEVKKHVDAEVFEAIQSSV